MDKKKHLYLTYYFNLTCSKKLLLWNPAYIVPRFMICVYSKFRYLGVFVPSTNFGIFNPHPQKKVWPGGTQPMLISESSCAFMKNFRYEDPVVFFDHKYLFFFLTWHTQKEVWPCKGTQNIALVTLNEYVHGSNL